MVARRRWPWAWATLAESDLFALAAELRRQAGDALIVDWETDRGGVGASLVRAATGSDLLVVGCRVGLFTERLVSPSLHHVLTHASCPVVVVADAGEVLPV